MAANDRFFFDRYGLSQDDLERYLAEALSDGGDYADLYFEHTTATSLQVDESLVKSALEGISMGCGIRVLQSDEEYRQADRHYYCREQAARHLQTSGKCPRRGDTDVGRAL